MYKMEFMILYLAEIALAAVFISAAYLLFCLAAMVFDLIKKILKKGGDENGKRE